MKDFPFTKDHPSIDDEADSWLIDSEFEGLVTVEGRRLVMHDVFLTDEAAQGARSGAGRRALGRLRPLFDEIEADGAIVEEDGCEAVLQFWGAMLREGLIDTLVLAQCGRRITRADIGNPVETARGVLTIHSAGVDLAADTRPSL